MTSSGGAALALAATESAVTGSSVPGLALGGSIVALLMNA